MFCCIFACFSIINKIITSSDTHVIVKNYTIKPLISYEYNYSCYDAYVFALKTIIDNYSHVKKELGLIIDHYEIREFLFSTDEEDFFEYFLESTKIKLESRSSNYENIYVKLQNLDILENYAQKTIYLHLIIISYESINFWIELLFEKHNLPIEDQNRKNMLDLIINKDFLNNHLVVNFEKKKENNLFTFDSIKYNDLLVNETIDIFTDIFEKFIIKYMEKIYGQNLENKTLEKSQNIIQNYNDFEKNYQITYLYEIEIKLNCMYMWLYNLKLLMIKTLNDNDFVNHYVLNFHIFDYQQTIEKINAINEIKQNIRHHYYISSYYIFKQFLRMVDKRELIIYANKIFKEILNKLKDQNLNVLPIKIVVDIKGDLTYANNLLNKEFYKIQNSIAGSQYSLDKRSTWLVFNLRWLETYTFISTIKKFKSFGVEIENEKNYFYDQHNSKNLLLSEYYSENKLQYILLSTMFNFTDSINGFLPNNSEYRNNLQKRILFNYDYLILLYNDLCAIYEISRPTIDNDFISEFKKYYFFTKENFIGKFFNYCRKQKNQNRIQCFKYLNCFFEKSIKKIIKKD
ncbi:hypothetical protein GVAV_001646 [Gurleya vavrai]